MLYQKFRKIFCIHANNFDYDFDAFDALFNLMIYNNVFAERLQNTKAVYQIAISENKDRTVLKMNSTKQNLSIFNQST